MYILKSKDVNKSLYNMNKNYQGQQVWRESFYNTELQRQRNLSQLDYDYNQMVGEAYLSALRNEQQIYDSQLSDAYKSDAAIANLSNLHDAYESYKKSHTENLTKVNNSYNQINTAIQNELNTQSQNVVNLQNAYFDYWNNLQRMYDEGELTYDKITTIDDIAEFINWSPTTDEPTANDLAMDSFTRADELLSETSDKSLYNSDGTLNDRGIKFFNMLDSLGTRGLPSFSDYLYNNRRELFDWYSSSSYNQGQTNYDMFKQLQGR